MKTNHLLQVLIAALMMTAPMGAEQSHRHSRMGTGLNTQVADDVATCADIEVSSGEYEVAAAEETLSPASNQLQVTAPRNGGAWISGGPAGAFEVRACKYGMGRDRADAEAALASIHIDQTGGELTARGGDSDRWLVHFIVRAPRGASTTVETTNGPISIRDVEGTLKAHAVNGPIGIKGARGTIEVDTVNGPIAVEGTSGDVQATAQNGPLSVKLDGTEWSGEGLRGETRNGPLSLVVPSDYRTGVVVESDGHSPFRCTGCTEEWRGDEERPRRVRFGTDAERVRLTTSNGPVTIKR
jgi:hypothetical protein